MRSLLFTISFLVLMPVLTMAETVKNTITWPSEPAAVEVYKAEKQVQTGGNANAPWTALPDVPAGTKQLIDTGNPVNIKVCYRITPTNTKPSSGAPASGCSQLIPIDPVGDMPTIVVTPSLVP